MAGLPHVKELLRSGQITRLDSLAEVRDSRDLGGRRVIDIRLAGGLSFEVLPDSGLDIGSVWHRGSPVSWRSALPTAGDNFADPVNGFLSRFTGGMLVTCGLENIGAARDGQPMHGTYHRSSATDVNYRREVIGENIVVTVTGLVGSMDLFGHRVTVERRIVSQTGTPRLEVTDRIHNEGRQPTPIALLYHLNFGAPFLDEGTRVDVKASDLIPQFDILNNADATTFPAPAATLTESVFEHALPEGRVTVLPRRGGSATIEWDPITLPRLFQWVWPAQGGWALGIEPSNSPLFGEERNLPNAGAPLLDPGVTVETGFSLTLFDHQDLPRTPQE